MLSLMFDKTATSIYTDMDMRSYTHVCTMHITFGPFRFMNCGFLGQAAVVELVLCACILGSGILVNAHDNPLSCIGMVRASRGHA